MLRGFVWLLFNEHLTLDIKHLLNIGLGTNLAMQAMQRLLLNEKRVNVLLKQFKCCLARILFDISFRQNAIL